MPCSHQLCTECLTAVCPICDETISSDGQLDGQPVSDIPSKGHGPKEDVPTDCEGIESDYDEDVAFMSDSDTESDAPYVGGTSMSVGVCGSGNGVCDMSGVQLVSDRIAELHRSANAREGALRSLHRKVAEDSCLSFLLKNQRIRGIVGSFCDECGDIAALESLLQKKDLDGLHLLRKIEYDIKAPHVVASEMAEGVGDDGQQEHPQAQEMFPADARSSYVEDERRFLQRIYDECVVDLGADEADVDDTILDLVMWASSPLPASNVIRKRFKRDAQMGRI